MKNREEHIITIVINNTDHIHKSMCGADDDDDGAGTSEKNDGPRGAPMTRRPLLRNYFSRWQIHRAEMTGDNNDVTNNNSKYKCI